MMRVNREITVFGLDGRTLAFHVPVKAQKTYGDNFVQWSWKNDGEERKYLTISLHGIIYYEEKMPV